LDRRFSYEGERRVKSMELVCVANAAMARGEA
jgi:hypothetical protein